jgi:glycolate oxidase FAD binding subunit
MTIHRPTTTDELAELVAGSPGPLLPRGGGSKPALSAGATVELGGLSGVVEYHSEEFTLTALAGTPVAELRAVLAENGQHLPFDPPLASRGATLGGTVAAGLSGPGRLRHGGVRDFLLAVRWVDGRGIKRRGGAPVVKNSAGFDLPKLMVGSLGRLGLLTELTFKVFPRPTAHLTGRFVMNGFVAARGALGDLLHSPFDLEGLELLPPATLLVRLGGPPGSLAGRLGRLVDRLGRPVETLEEEAEEELWRSLGDLDDLRGDDSGQALVKIPATPGRLPELEALLADLGARRRYGAGAAVAWTALPVDTLVSLDAELNRLGLGALVLEPAGASPRLGHRPGESFLGRLRGVLDPDRRFVPADSGESSRE